MPNKRYELLLHREAVQELAAMPKSARVRVVAAMDDLAKNPLPVGAQRLKGRVAAYRMRVGDYRILYEVHVREIVVYVFGIGHRKEVYQRFLKRR